MNTNLLKELAIVIGEDPKICDKVLEALEKRGEIWRIEFEILLNDLANRGEIKVDI
jgi:hypothetical protein